MEACVKADPVIRPKITTLDMAELTQMVWGGRIRIPHFQRPLRWQRGDVIRLFDSIASGYPIGSFLFWQRAAPEEKLQLGALRILAPSIPDSLWVVDGQQRIISLANALHPDGLRDKRFALAYDLRNERFVPLPSTEESTVIPLPSIFDLASVLRWFSAHPEATEYVDRATEITRAIRDYRVPAYEVVEDDPQVLVEIFDRINSYGKRLSRAEIFSGLFSGEGGASDAAATFDRIAQNIDDGLGFGLIDNDTIVQSVLARRGPDVRREIRNEFGDAERAGPSRERHELGHPIIEFTGEDRDTAYDGTEEALRQAVIFLQNQADVPHLRMLPYRYLLVVLTRFFAHHPTPDPRSLQLLRRWFWRAALVGPDLIQGGVGRALRSLNHAIKPNDLAGSIAGLLRLVDRPNPPFPNLGEFKVNWASTKIILCSWWSLEPRSLETGDPFERQDLSLCLQDRPSAFDAVRLIVSRYSVPSEFRLLAADRVLLPETDDEGGSVDSILLAPPDSLDAEVWSLVLTSHCLSPVMVEALSSGQTTEFLNRRQEALQVQLTDFLERRCEWGFEDTPSIADLVVEDEEPEENLDDAR
jgi:uncharacterized protein DUF262